MSSDVERWSGDRRLEDVVSEFWKDFSTSWAALKAAQWPVLGSADRANEDFSSAVEALHRTALNLNALLHSLTDYLSNRASAVKDSDVTSLIAFIHDLRAPVAAIRGFSEPEVVSAFRDDAHFLQWRDLMIESLTRIDRVVAGNTAFSVNQQSAS